jgi:hypothetical protein
MLSYRFSEIIDKVKIDYIIFLHFNTIEIDLAVNYPDARHGTCYFYPIVNKIIDWKNDTKNVNNKSISLECKKYCQKLVSLGLFL